MNNDDNLDLEGQIRMKEEALERQIQLMARYEQTIGRDRWFNRGQHEVHTLRTELAALLARRPRVD